MNKLEKRRTWLLALIPFKLQPIELVAKELLNPTVLFMNAWSLATSYMNIQYEHADLSGIIMTWLFQLEFSLGMLRVCLSSMNLPRQTLNMPRTNPD